VTAYVSTSLVIPCFPGVPALPVVLDVTSFRVPEHHTRRTRLFEHTLMGRVVRRHPLIFGSQATAADAQHLFPQAMGVVVLPWFPQRLPGSAAAAGSLADLGIHKPYVLMVGTVEPRKNHRLAAQVVVRLRERGRDLRLVVVGSRGWASDSDVANLRELERQGAIVWPGYVTDDQRDALYAEASAFLLPSVYEGFGMPLVEAMAAGLPCCCSSIPALEEVAGDAALRLDPAQPHLWVEAIEGLLDSPKLADKLKRAGLARAATYSRERTGQAFARALAQRR
jgi:glycosyltransferase involved in cell wall biosynthesis